MKALYRLPLVAAMLWCFAVPGAQAQTPATNLVFLESKEAKGPIPRERVRACLAQFVREMGLADKELPAIFVIHVPKSAGMRAGVAQTTVRASTSVQHPDRYYELWVVDNSKLNDYVVAFERILEDHFQLQLADGARNDLLARVAKYLNTTVNALGE